ncbi:hypothetical protein [Rhizobium sp. 2MFCol3.1]|uniref:hypothetical protein n=1 Tax=Rhizobium sp. 2MFCol3.1 TaxID=1246459 RepID=UPI00037ECBB4|nr:hypothetical protein [Rhizobium sp. 2MFCol3.1]
MTTLGELIDSKRRELAEETVGVRRSWEDMFKYTLKHYPKDTSLQDFDVEALKALLVASDLNPPIVDGYVKRWRALLGR